MFTTVWEEGSEWAPIGECLYIAGTSVEERSWQGVAWQDRSDGIKLARVVGDEAFFATVEVEQRRYRIPLRGTKGIQEFIENQGRERVYLDITGLSHRVWAPLLRGVRSREGSSYCVYVEPGDYQFSREPTEASIFDLSESIEGISPLPGFASFSRRETGSFVFVPLLGFEGTRFAYMLESEQPNKDRVVPVIGVPGFRAEYPFYTYMGNRLKLAESRSWRNVRYAPANCPFSLYQVLEELAGYGGARHMVIAPIGTKPHALGAVLYCLDHPRGTELVYDHPVRKEKRTVGLARVCVYDLTRLPRLGEQAGGGHGA